MSTEYLANTTTNWGTAANWSGSAVPVTGDTVYLDQRASAGIDAGLDQHLVLLAALYVNLGMTQTIGTATAPLQIGATAFYFGLPSNTTNAGSGRFNVDLGSSAATGYVLNTGGSSTDTGLEPLRIKCNNSSSRLFVSGGRVGIATSLPSDTATLGEIDVSGSAVVNVAAGVTWTTIKQLGSSVLAVNSGGTTLTQLAGTLTTFGTGAITTTTVGGTAKLNMRAASGATIGTLIVLPGGTADFSDLPSNVTITNVQIYAGGKIVANAANPGHVIITNQIVPVNCGILSAQ
jgi:hypothetical protein